MQSFWPLLFAVTALSCSKKATEESASLPVELKAEVQMSDASAPAAQRAAFAPAFQQSMPGGMIIRTGNARIEVDSLERAAAAVQSLAQQFGGHVTNIAMQAGREQLREATIEIRIPSLRFEAAIAGLSSLGEVEAVNVVAQDVGEEFVDVQARLANGRRLETRLIELLATRTGKLADVLAVEHELARVREEIERAEGRLRYLQNQVALSTLSVTVHEAVPLVAAYRGQNVILRAAQQAWRNFVGLVAGLIAAMGVLIPVFVVAWLGWVLARRYRRRFHVLDARP